MEWDGDQTCDDFLQFLILLPVGSRFTAPSDVTYHATPADRVLARMEAAGMGVKLLILDACRNTPSAAAGRAGST